MADKATTKRELFEAVDNIETIDVGDGKFLIKVMSESAVGQFMRLRRVHNIRTTNVTRGDLSSTVLDAYGYEN